MVVCESFWEATKAATETSEDVKISNHLVTKHQTNKEPPPQTLMVLLVWIVT